MNLPEVSRHAAVAISIALLLFLTGPHILVAEPTREGPVLDFTYSVERTPEQQAKHDAYLKALKSYPLLLEWQRAQGNVNLGEREYRVDLNGDGVKERLVSHGGPARYSWYIIFARIHGRWRRVGEIDMQSHTALKVLKARHHGWHDFSVDIEGPRSLIKRYIYSWSVKERGYDLKSEDQIRPMEDSETALEGSSPQ